VGRGPIQPIFDRLSELRAQLERLVLTHRWTLRETVSLRGQPGRFGLFDSIPLLTQRATSRICTTIKWRSKRLTICVSMGSSAIRRATFQRVNWSVFGWLGQYLQQLTVLT
jgi:hypothetical protein